MTIVAISGGFDPIHDGHIALMTEAKKLGDQVLCIVNSDDFLIKKKGELFYPSIDTRMTILKHVCTAPIELECTYRLRPIRCIDLDQTVCRTLERFVPHIFANGGDRVGESSTPEAETCRRLGIQMAFGVGGNHKSNSSSDLHLRR